MSAYTNVAKPTGVPYTNINAPGRQQYDQADISYDDSGTYYDGVDQNAYTSISKPVGASYTNIAKPTT